MKVRRKLALLILALMVLGIMTSISFSILFIRNHLYTRQEEQLQTDALRTARTLLATKPENQQAVLRALRNTLPNPLRLQGPQPDSALGVQETFPPAESTGPWRNTPYAGLRWRLLHSGGNLAVEVHLPTTNALGLSRLQVVGTRQQVKDQLRPMRWIIYGGMFVAVALAAGLGLGLARAYSSPIVQLQRVTQRLANGDFEQLTRLAQRRDELGEIARGLNQMADRLRSDAHQLRELNDRQQRFYADITHEVSNPLQTLENSLELLELQAGQPEQQARYLTIARNQTARMGRLFQDLATLQQYDHGRVTPHQQQLKLSDLVQQVVGAYADRIQAKGLELHTSQYPQTVWADPDLLEQVLDNLVSNALKYTQQGEIRVEYTAAKLESRTQPTGVQIRVADTGPGIAQDHLPRLTDRFYRTDTSRARSAGGTGLGLAVVETILRAHGSRLQVDSQPGQGSAFWFELPASNPSAPSES